MDSKREMLRHSVATLAYRGAKVMRDAPSDFAGYRSSETSRTPGEILAHLGDLLDWALQMAQGHQVWKASTPLAWKPGVERFFASLGRFDECLASDQPLGAAEERLFQGPVADALTHVGQLAMLRRMAGSPVRGENFFLAEIRAGHVGEEQERPRLEFG